MRFAITFNEVVTGVTAASFVKTGTCTADAPHTLTGTGAGPYEVTVDNISSSPSCTIIINFSETGVEDAATNALGAGVTGVTLTWGACLLCCSWLGSPTRL